MNNHVAINKLCKRLIGQEVPTNQNGKAGRYIENLIESWGLPINRGPGCDIEIFGLEIKSRDLDATSPQNVATMTPEQVCATPYCESLVHDKLQQQLRVFTQKLQIVDASVFDFSPAHIQDLISDAYERGRATIADHIRQFGLEALPSYVYGSEWGYWERICDTPSYTFRIHHGAYHRLEDMARTTFTNFFEYA